MQLVNKILFNTLCSYNGVNLPGIGYLDVERKQARIKGRGTVVAPHNVVVFGSMENQSLPSIVELIAREGNVDIRQGLAIYNEWLGKEMGINLRTGRASLPQNIVIKAVGEIRGKHFIPTKDLDRALNPVKPVAITVKPRFRVKHAVMIGVGVLLLAAAGVVYMRSTAEKGLPAQQKKEAVTAKKQDKLQPKPDQAIVAKKDTLAASKPLVTSPVDTTARETPVKEQQPAVKPTDNSAQKPAQATQKPVEQPAPQPVQKPAVSSSGPAYHLVMGVYSTMENAEKAIRQIKEKDGSLSLTIVPMGSKLIVSAYSSTDHAQAAAKMREMSVVYPDLWIYNKKQ